MFKFGIENLRRLKIVEPIDLKPITVLVGRNSAGKSTFLRSFALLRQSVTTRTSSPLLWFGVVDFGTFKGAVHNNDVKLDIFFTFEIESILTDPQPFFSPTNGMYFYSAIPSARTRYENVKLRVGVGSFDETSRLTSVELSMGPDGVRYSLSTGPDGFVTRFDVNGKRL